MPRETKLEKAARKAAMASGGDPEQAMDKLAADVKNDPELMAELVAELFADPRRLAGLIMEEPELFRAELVENMKVVVPGLRELLENAPKS
jgi:hypothetical protein